MAAKNDDSLWEEYTEEELEAILHQVEEFEREENGESDVDIDVDEEENEIAEDSEEESDADDNILLASLQTTWRSAQAPVAVTEFALPTGAVHTLPPDAKPLDYFFLFMPEHFFQTAATETNNYAQQKIADKGLATDPLWTDTTPDEIRAYLAILIMMGIKRLPRIHLYWSTDRRFSDSWISGTMPKTRFLKLNQYFHLRDTINTPGRDSPQYDPLFKIRPFLDMLQPLFKANYNPGRDLSIDESMIGYKGRLFFKQYMPAKPTKWGIKVWQMCEAETGYCVTFDVYTGRHSRQDTTVSLGEEVVNKLASNYFNQNRHLYFDRFFTSVPLLKHLRSKGTYACATVMSNRKGLPAEVKGAKLANRGDLLQMQQGSLMATVYRDKRHIMMLSTNQPPGKTVTVDKENPTIIAAYNKNMGGVDKCDQHLSYYPVGHANKKWWRYIFNSMMNLCVVQAFITWKKSPHDPPVKKRYDHLSFRCDIVDQLRAGFSSRKRAASNRTPTTQPPIYYQTIDQHKLVRREGCKRVCRQCVIAGRRTAKNGRVETSYMCQFCEVSLCHHQRDCFRDYHQQNLVGQPRQQENNQ
ncbi:hypothetical protein ACOMHN_025081 [Nucella lapillus]